MKVLPLAKLARVAWPTACFQTTSVTRIDETAEGGDFYCFTKGLVVGIRIHDLYARTSGFHQVVPPDATTTMQRNVMKPSTINTVPVFVIPRLLPDVGDVYS